MKREKGKPQETARQNDPGARGGENRTRLREIMAVLARHGIVKGLTPEKLRLIVEDLGPTFVKLGQIMSMRQDMLPAAYCRELTKLRAEVSPMPFDEVRAVVEEEYGRPMEAVFAEFQQEPLGSASIAQAHAAVLDGGERVVVKVQRRGVRETMSRDIVLLRKAARLLRLTAQAGSAVDFPMMLDEMWAVAQQEMDFLIEARHAQEFRRNNRDVAYVTCPAVYPAVTTSRVLVMEYIDGLPVDDNARLREEGYDPSEIGVKLAENYVKQIIEDAFFQADPHPGNLRIRGGKIVWLDLGMMGRLSERDKSLIKKAMAAVAEHDVSTLKDVLLTLGVHSGRINHARLYADIDDLLTQYGSMSLGAMDLGRMMEELLTLAGEHGISMPPGITMLSRGVLTMQGVLASLDPEINIVEIMANHLSGSLLQDFDLAKELREGGKSLLYSGRKTVDIPGQMSDLLKMAIKGQTKMNLEITGSEEPMEALNRMTNKVVLCIIDAALFIGSSLICTTDMKPRFLGIPALGALGYLAAIILGGCLLVRIIRRK